LGCYYDPFGWKQKIQNQQHQGNNAKLLTKKESITVYISVKDVTKWLSFTTELGGFEGEGKKYFSVVVDSVC